MNEEDGVLKQFMDFKAALLHQSWPFLRAKSVPSGAPSRHLSRPAHVSLPVQNEETYVHNYSV